MSIMNTEEAHGKGRLAAFGGRAKRPLDDIGAEQSRSVYQAWNRGWDEAMDETMSTVTGLGETAGVIMPGEAIDGMLEHLRGLEAEGGRFESWTATPILNLVDFDTPRVEVTVVVAMPESWRVTGARLLASRPPADDKVSTDGVH